MFNAQHLSAILWVLGGTLLFSLVFASAKILNTDLAPISIIFIRYTRGFLIMSLLKSVFRFEVAPLTPRRVTMHATRALFGGSGGIAAIYAAAHLPVTKAAAIGLLDGAIAVFLGIIFLSERASPLRALGLLLSLVAAYLLVFSSGESIEGITTVDLPTLVALFGALFVALEGLLIRVLAQRESANSALFYVNCLGALIFAAPGIYFLAGSAWEFLLPVCILGPIAIAGQYCFLLGYRSADLAIVAPVGYSWIIFAAIISYFLGESILGIVWISSLLIVLSGFVLVLDHE